MRVIFERDIEHCDFLEIILSKEELDSISRSGCVQEFDHGLEKNKPLNVFIRLIKGD